MKFFRILVIALFAAGTLFAQDFEGYLKYKVEGDRGQTVTIKYYKKGDKVRMEPDIGQKTALIVNGGKTYMILSSQGMYMEFDSRIAEQMNKADNLKEPVKTGKSKMILGYMAEEWIFNDANYTSDVWVSTDLGSFVALSTPMQKSQMPGWYSDIVNKNFFPLVIEAKDKDGDIQGRMEVTEITPTPLSSGLFEIPEGYTKLDIPTGGK